MKKVKIFKTKKHSVLLLFLLAIAFVSSAVSTAGETTGEKELVIAKPFGPSVKVPYPAKGSNGWYTSEAGVTETLFILDFDLNLQPWLVKSFKNINPLVWEIQLKKGILFHDNTPLQSGQNKLSPRH